MSQSSSNVNPTNTNSPSTPQSQPPFQGTGFAGFSQLQNPITNFIPNYTPDQQSSILNTFWQNPNQAQLQAQSSLMYNQAYFQLIQQQQQQQQQQPLLQVQQQPQPQARLQEIEESQDEVVAETQEIQQTQDVATSSKGKKKCVKVLWNGPEEESLASIWIHVSEDSVTGNAQKTGTFWEKIMTEYNNWARQNGFPIRTRDQITSKFTTISGAVKAFVGHYAEAQRTRGSGRDDSETLQAATDMYCSLVGGSTFRYTKCWTILRDHPKWRAYAKLEVPTSNTINLDDDFLSDNIFSDDTAERPPGKKSEKKRKESSSASENAQDKSSAFCGMMIAQMKKLRKNKKDTNKVKKETLKAQQEAAYAAARETDMRFLASSTESMSESQREWVEAEKIKVKAKYGIN